MAVVALIALLIIGPKDLPKVMRSAAHWAGKARGLAREFQSGVDDMIREADLEDARKAVDVARSLDVRKAVSDAVDPTGDLLNEARDVENAAREAGDAIDSDGAGKDASNDKDENDKDETIAADNGAEPNIAPPHSLTPSEESPETIPNPEPASQSTADDGAGKRAS